MPRPQMPPVGTRITVAPGDEVVDFGDGTYAVKHPTEPGVWIECVEVGDDDDVLVSRARLLAEDE